MVIFRLISITEGERIRIPHLPKWLDEGICQWSSDGISELLIQNKGDVLRTALLSGNIIAL
ncbi:MAG: hypothetical protein AB7S75_13350, partial [Desulfococcaceae bacterium]